MVLRVDVVCAALEAVYGCDCATVRDERPVFVLSPRGRRFGEPVIGELLQYEELTLLCGRYEGVDQRVSEHLASGEISIGDYVLSGGELPAMVIVDALARRLPGALGSEDSAIFESFSEQMEGGAEHPQYTKPAEFRGWRVPDVLLSGNHAEIDAWRRKHSGSHPG
jgi:tRNA (guanine37-N1)-methyltransferase